MSSHANHRRGHKRILERGPRWESRNPAKGCNSTHVARTRRKLALLGRRKARRVFRSQLSELEAAMALYDAGALTDGF